MRLINIEHLEMRLRELGWFEPDEFDTEIKLKCILDYEPTAYDVDKVVEQLEETLLNLTFHKDNDSKTWNKAIHKAKEIVKSGGIE